MTPSTHEALADRVWEILERRTGGTVGLVSSMTVKKADIRQAIDAALLPDPRPDGYVGHWPPQTVEERAAILFNEATDPKADGAGNVGLSLGGEILTRADVIGRLKHGGEHLGNAIAGYRDKDNHRAAHGLFEAATAMLNAIAWLEHDADALSTLSRERDEARKTTYYLELSAAEATIAELTARLAEAEKRPTIKECIKAIHAAPIFPKQDMGAGDTAARITLLDQLAKHVESILAASPSQGQPTKASGVMALVAHHLIADAGYDVPVGIVHRALNAALASPAKASEPQWRADLLEGGGKGK